LGLYQRQSCFAEMANGNSLRLASSYDFERQMAVFVPTDIALPAERGYLADLEALRAINDRELDRRYNWDRFAGQVEAAIDSEIAPAAVQMGTAERVGLAMASLGYGHSPIRPRNALHLLRTNAARVAARVRGAGVRP